MRMRRAPHTHTSSPRCASRRHVRHVMHSTHISARMAWRSARYSWWAGGRERGCGWRASVCAAMVESARVRNAQDEVLDGGELGASLEIHDVALAPRVPLGLLVRQGDELLLRDVVDAAGCVVERSEAELVGLERLEDSSLRSSACGVVYGSSIRLERLDHDSLPVASLRCLWVIHTS